MAGHLFVCAHVQLQNGLLVAKTGPVIVYADGELAGCLPHADANLVFRPLGGVVHQVAEYFESVSFVNAPLQAGRAVNAEGQPLVGINFGQRIANAAHYWCQAQVGCKPGRPAGRRPA